LIKLSTHSTADPRGSSLVLVIGILGGTLVLVIILTAVVFYIYTKRITNRITKQIANQNKPQSGEIETYDELTYDIELQSDLGGKGIYHAYDVIVDEEVSYADPYYSAAHCNAEKRLQSSNDYSRIPTSEPIYLQIIPVPTP